MRHHANQPDSKFVIKPEHFDKYTDVGLLRYCLGATMYMPGTKDFLGPIINRIYPGLTSMVMCFEDACPKELVSTAEEKTIKLLDSLKESFEKLAAQDDSGPAMSNTQSVYAGLTYGKGTLNESTSSGNRGFTV